MSKRRKFTHYTDQEHVDALTQTAHRMATRINMAARRRVFHRRRVAVVEAAQAEEVMADIAAHGQNDPYDHPDRAHGPVNYYDNIYSSDYYNIDEFPYPTVPQYDNSLYNRGRMIFPWGSSGNPW